MDKEQSVSHSDYHDLWGESFLDELVARKDVRALEILWRLNDPNPCAALIPRMLEVRDDRLTALVAEDLLGEALDATIGTALAQRLLQGELPPLPAKVVTALVERLRREDPFTPEVEPARPALTVWVVEQQDEASEALALDLLTGEVDASDEAVLEACRARAARSAGAFAKAVAGAREGFADAPSPESWIAAEHLFSAGVRERRAASMLRPLGVDLLTLAPQLNEGGSFSEELAEFACTDGSSTALEVLSGAALPDQPGARALTLICLADGSPVRYSCAQALARHQPQLWPLAMQGSGEWSTSEWRKFLTAIKAPIHDSAMTSLIEEAPVALLRPVLALALDIATTYEDDHLTDVGVRLKEVLDDQEPPPDPRVLLNTVPWQSLKTDDSPGYLKAIFEEALTADQQAAIVVSAYEGNKVSAEVAAALIRDDGEAATLKTLTPGRRRARLAQQLVEGLDGGDVWETDVGAAIEETQRHVFGVDLAALVAADSPAIAFTGGIDAYPSLSQEDKNQLVSLLEGHGTADQLPILEAVVEDGQKGSADRRRRAALRIGALIGERGTIPGVVLDLLTSSNSTLRATAIEIVEKVKPREGDAISRLRDLTTEGGVPGQLSAKALDAIAEAIITELGKEPAEQASLTLLPLLGRTGRPLVFGYLFGFVGVDPHWDNVDVRRAAAEAIQDAAEIAGEISLDDQDTLSQLIEGEQPEVDPQAVASLRTALSRIELGEDEALTILYGFLPSPPNIGPDKLFGEEKETLVTHLGLYTRAKSAQEHGRVLGQLDIIAAALARAAYLHYGKSEPLKDQIRASRYQRDYGNLIGAIGNTSKMNSIGASLGVIHELRSDKSQEAHPGEKAEPADVEAAEHALRTVAKRCVQLLKSAVGT